MTRAFVSGFSLLAACCAALAGCSSGGGTSTTPIATPPIATTAKAKFAYTGNQGASLSGFAVDANTGALTPLSGFPMSFGVNPTVVATDPQNRFLLVGDIAADQLSVFSVNSTTGALTLVGARASTGLREPVGMVVDPSGTHVYVAAQGSNVVGAYTLSAAGTLTPGAGQPFATGGSQMFGEALALNASGTFLYLQESGDISVFAVNGSTGALTLVQTVPGSPIGGGIALDPGGAFLYAAESSQNQLFTYAINTSTGMLTQAHSIAFPESYALAILPNGAFAFSTVSTGLTEYSVNNGVLTPLRTVSGVYASQLGVDPGGSFVYLPRACSQNCPGGTYNTVDEFSINSAGTLTQSASPATAGSTPWGIAFITH